MQLPYRFCSTFWVDLGGDFGGQKHTKCEAKQNALKNIPKSLEHDFISTWTCKNKRFIRDKTTFFTKICCKTAIRGPLLDPQIGAQKGPKIDIKSNEKINQVFWMIFHTFGLNFWSILELQIHRKLSRTWLHHIHGF